MRLITVLISLLFAIGESADLHTSLRHFEVLNSEDLNVVSRTKRSADGILSQTKHIRFTTLGRNFNLVLHPGSPVLSPDFKAVTVDKHGKKHPFYVDPNKFFTGHLADDSSVSVEAHFEDGVLSSSIYLQDDTYVVEPAWRHRETSDNFTMISYRGSDVNWDEILPIDPKTGKRTRMKDGIRLGPKNDLPKENYDNSDSTGNGHSRTKRRAGVKQNTCPLMVVSDYTFFRDMGNKQRQTTAAFIISRIQGVNNYYKRTVFDAENGYFNMGFQIAEMMIHTSFTNVSGHYNSDQAWHYNAKLYAFSVPSKVTRVCLSHLFTSYPFQDNVLGLAFIAPESVASAGGICSPATFHGNYGRIYPRTGWTSLKNERGRQVLSLQSELVTTHELGHNWGAEHDPERNLVCAPKSNGKYIMWAYSVPGYEKNNKNFSPCSIRLIAPVLRSKSHYCFKEFVEKVEKKTDEEVMKKQSFCGNGIIEEKEECDYGFAEENMEDACCASDCKLKPNAVCSDFNSVCCRNCHVANTTVVCAFRNDLTCRGESYCDGNSLTCPAAPSVPDNTTCIDLGKCIKGKCLNYCGLHGANQGKIMQPCLCTQNTTAMCRRCCAVVNPKTKETEDCLPTEDLLQDGRTCHIGICNINGECVKLEQQLAFRIFRFIKELTVDSLVEFMKSNIVGTIIVLSLVIWIPASWVVSCVDKRNIVENERDMQRWVSREHSIMGGNIDKTEFRIKNSRFKKVPPSTLRNVSPEVLQQSGLKEVHAALGSSKDRGFNTKLQHQQQTNPASVERRGQSILKKNQGRNVSNSNPKTAGKSNKVRSEYDETGMPDDEEVMDDVENHDENSDEGDDGGNKDSSVDSSSSHEEEHVSWSDDEAPEGDVDKRNDEEDD